MTAAAPAPTTEIPLRLNFDPVALAAAASATSAEARECAALAIHTDAAASVVAEFLREQMRQKDAVKAMLKSAITPLDVVEKTIRSWFEPTLAAFEQIERSCKKALGDFRTSQEARARAALATATAAATAHDVGAMTTALVEANAPIAKQAGVPIRSFWRATVINAGLLPPDWTITIPDAAKIAAHAKACSADKTPEPIPGVRFELETSVTVRR